MGKQGPCYHCGVTNTPLWRNGPPEKPILCNACGSRWRTKGTLSNYTPLHARAESSDPDEFRVSKLKTISIKNKEPKLHKKKQYHILDEAEGGKPDMDQHFRKVLEEDMSNRSSSGSAISYSESCSQFGASDLNDLTGPAQSNVWDSLVPSKKRTCINRTKTSSVEKLTKELHFIMQSDQSSYLSGSSEEDLLFESETPMVSVEIGHGGVLIKHPNLVARDEESVASSFLTENKAHTLSEVYSGSSTLSVNVEHKGITSQNSTKEKIRQFIGQGAQDHTKRDKFSHEKSHILRNSHSPLRFIDLKDVINFEEFTEHFSHQEQQQMMKYLSSIDTLKPPESLKSMFSSPQFADDLASFQQLLLEGVFDLSFTGITAEECKILKRLVLVNLSKSKWVEQYKLLKDGKCTQIMGGKGANAGPGSGCGTSLSVKRPRDSQNQNFSEPKGTMRSPKRLQKNGSTSLLYTRAQFNSSEIKSSYDARDLMEYDGSCFSPRSLFASPLDSNSVMLDPLEFAEGTSDQDLLLNVPSNASFPHAELLVGHHHHWKQKPNLAEKP